MSKTYLGIDLGTSSVKVLLAEDAKVVERTSVLYEERTVEGWWAAVHKALSQLSGRDKINAIGLSSQVGTYIINQKEILHWNGPEGSTELHELLERYPQEVFIAETGMPHPALVSYPLPRLSYARKHFSPLNEVIQPKDMLIRRLCGKAVSDPYSWRGLANAGTLQYSSRLLRETVPESGKFLHTEDPPLSNTGSNESDLLPLTASWKAKPNESILPPLTAPWSCAGRITPCAAEETGLPAGTPVYTGLNDFYAALLGMGISKPGDWFDITGTSEHLGVIFPSLPAQNDLIASPYLQGAVCYGVTASSGASLDFGRKIFPEEIFTSERQKNGTPAMSGFQDHGIYKFGDPARQRFEHLDEYLADAPVFLPYLNGERAPIFDSSAKGAFYGITGRCTKEHMAYSVLEGVAFSVYHIYEHLLNNADSGQEYRKALSAQPVVRISGGAGTNPLLTYLKAELLQKTFSVVSETDASALGAVFVAMKGEGAIDSLKVAENFVSVAGEIRPDGRFRAALLKRFQLYKDFYAGVKNLRRN